MERKYKFYTLSGSENPEQIRYVGVTSRELNQRLSQHKYTGKNPKKRNTPVAKWIFSLFEKNQEVIITQIDECNITEWENKEIELIKKYQELGYNLLNLDPGGKGIITKEKREKEGIQRSAEAHKVKVVQLDLQGNYITTFKSINAAKEAMGLKSKSAISNVLRGKSKTSCNSFWVYESDYLANNYIINNEINKHILNEGIKYYQYCPETFSLIKCYLSERSVINEFLQSKNSNSTGLKNAVSEKITWKDFYWTLEETIDFSNYFNDKYKVLELTLDNNVVNKFKTNIDAAKYFNIANSTISNYIRNKTLTKNNTYLIKNKKIKI